MNEVLQGIIQATQVATALKREAMAAEAQKRLFARQDREDEMRDLDFDLRMRQAGGRAVSPDGLVEDRVVSEGKDIPGMIGAADLIPAGTVLGETLRKAKPGQTIRYRTRKGEERSYEIPTVEEQRAAAEAAALEQYQRRQKIDDESSLNRAKELYDYQRKGRAEDAAAQPRVDVRDPEFLRAVPLDMLGAVANLRRTVEPDYKMTTDYETGTPSFVGVDPVTRQPVSVRDPRWEGASKPRPRQGRGQGRGQEQGQSQGAAAAKSGGRKAGEEAKFQKIEEMKRRDLQAAEASYKLHKDPERLRTAKQRAQDKYEQAIVRAGGKVEHVEYRAGEGAEGAQARAGKLTADDYLKQLENED